MKKLLEGIKATYQKDKGEIRFLVGFWIFYVIYNMVWYYGEVRNFHDLLRVAINYPVYGLVVFAPNNYILRKYILKKKYIKGVIWILIGFILFTIIRYYLNYFIFPSLNIFTPYLAKPFNLILFISSSISIHLMFSILSFGYAFGKYSIELEARERKLAEANTKLQHQRDMTQIAFLQAQINPHFLYNTLNFIYSEAIMVSDSVAESIMTLSNIMRYTLTETGKDTLVSLYSEVNHIKNYLRLQKMRFSNELYLDLIVEGEENINHLEILPLVLISFVENIFKHGDIHDPDHPAKIVMNVEENSFYLSIYNRKNKGPKEHSSGVGMNNIRVRMDILYGEKYQVKILTDTEDEFALEFTISDMEEAFRNLKKYKILNQ
jgi:two-component system, LytTR family, sensor kinase